MKTPLFISLSLFICFEAMAQKPLKLTSPDGNLQFIFRLLKTGPQYDVIYKGKPVITGGQLGVTPQYGSSTNNLPVTPQARDREEKYSLITGKTSQVQERYREMIIPPLPGNQVRPMVVTVRAFNDGIAFRYTFSNLSDRAEFTLAGENTSFPIPAASKTLALFLPNFTTSHEGLYNHLPWSKVKEDTLIDLPVLFEVPGNVYVAITEAALIDYAGMYLTKKQGVPVSILSPLPGEPGTVVKGQQTKESPWRVLMISDRVGALIESNILTTLSPACRIDDLSWIKPGKTTWPWWNGNIIPDTTFAGGNNFETNQYYIDFCARNGIEYHSVVEYGSHEWYVNDGANFQPGPNADPTKAVPGLDMQQVCDYAKSKGVGIRVWVHWGALYPKLDAAFEQYEKWGIKGLMVDFMDRDDQQMVNMQQEILEKAAKHKLHIQFHGVQKPTGLSRTWPNEFTREGVMNYEYNKWTDFITPDHDVNVAFTRLLAGSTDYHLGGFRAAPPAAFKVQNQRPLMNGTRCHMLAMYVVLENTLGMLADYPAAYEGQPGFEFLEQVPTTWDETRVPDAKVGEYVIIARRKKDDWYIGSITNSKAREIKINLNFLSPGEYTAEIYSDTELTEKDPNQLKKETRIVKNTDTLTVKLSAGGGLAVRLRKGN